MQPVDIPIKLSEALYLAAEIAKKNEILEAELTHLRMNRTKEVLRGPEIVDLLEISKSTLSEWSQDPSFPHMRGDWTKGMAVMCRASELYEWLKNKKARDIDRNLNRSRVI